jgi:hypothetical protein
MRFGVGGHHEHTLEAVGDVLGLTRERVRQLELVAKHFLRLRLLWPSAELGKTTRVIKGTKKEPRQKPRKPRPGQRLVRVPNSPN